MYNALIALIIVLKVIYTCIAITYRISILKKWSPNTISYILSARDATLSVSEVFMYLVLVILFFPTRHVSDIKIGREEQIIIFALGVLGLIHTNWDMFIKLFELLQLN